MNASGWKLFRRAVLKAKTAKQLNVMDHPHNPNSKIRHITEERRSKLFYDRPFWYCFRREENSHLFTVDSLNLSCFGFEQWHSGEPTTWKWKWSSWVTLPLSQRRPWGKLFHSFKQWKTLDSMLFRKETSWSSKQYETLKTQRCSRFIDPDTIKKTSSIVI